MAEFSSAFEQIMGDTAVDDLSGYTVETFGRSRAIAPTVSITPAVLTPPPTSMGKTTSGLSSMYSSIGGRDTVYSYP
jgi:hypothetical protein